MQCNTNKKIKIKIKILRRKIEIKRIANFLVILCFKLNLLAVSRVYHNHSFLLVLALRIMACVMAQLVPTGLNLDPNLIEIIMF